MLGVFFVYLPEVPQPTYREWRSIQWLVQKCFDGTNHWGGCSGQNHRQRVPQLRQEVIPGLIHITQLFFAFHNVRGTRKSQATQTHTRVLEQTVNCLTWMRKCCINQTHKGKRACCTGFRPSTLTLSVLNSYLTVSPGPIGHWVTHAVPSLQGVPLCDELHRWEFNNIDTKFV